MPRYRALSKATRRLQAAARAAGRAAGPSPPTCCAAVRCRAWWPPVVQATGSKQAGSEGQSTSREWYRTTW